MTTESRDGAAGPADATGGAGASRLARLRRRLRGKRRRDSRGSAEISVAIVGASLVAGLAFGQGLTRTVVDITDGLTWISDDPSGEIIQVNPATGRPEKRLAVGAPGEDLEVSQADGRLFVTNRTTGEVFSVDLASVLVSGQRRVASGGATDLLLHDGKAFLVDRSTSSISRIDPSTTDAIGERWVATEGLADATIDGQGRVWAIDEVGSLVELRWSDAERRFVTEREEDVDYAGDGSVLVGHDRGVTVFGPDAGIVVQVGTGDDVVGDAPSLVGSLLAPASAPADLAPVASPDTGTVVIVGAGQLREVDLTTIDCAKPGRPAVHRDLVYVPCDGAGRIVVLDGSGRRAAADIPVPGERDAELVVDDGNLIVNVPGSQAGLVVRPDGRISDLTRYDDRVAPTRLAGSRTPPTPEQVRDIADADRPDPADLPDPPASTPPTAATTPPSNGTPPTGSTTAPTAPTAPTPPVSPPTGGPTVPPVGPPGTVPPGGGGTPPNGGGDDDPPPTTPTTPGGPTTPTEPPPGEQPAELQAPTGVTATLEGTTAVVTWQHAGPAATGFDITVVGSDSIYTRSGPADRSARLTIPVGQPAQFVVTAVDGSRRAASAPSNQVTASTRPGMPGGLTGSVGTGPHTAGTVPATASWQAPADNGSPITGYRVVFTGGNPQTTQTQDLPADARSASWAVPCADTGAEECDAGRTTVRVTAVNAQGEGDAADAVIGNSVASAPRLPAGGNQHVTGESGGDLGYEGFGDVTLTLAPAADWSAFTGTCTYTTDSGSATMPCGQTSLTLSYNDGYQWVACDRGASRTITRNRSITFTADNGRTTVQSATYTFTTSQTALCEGQQIP
ncbi:MAG: fibronectin type III domain-containing protein [Nocardioides alkalitolerans]